MLFDKTETVETETAQGSDAVVMAGFRFDYKTNSYVMEAGTPVEVTGKEAVKAWLEQVIRTAQGRYDIYPSDFGARLQDLVGRKAPKGFDLSEFNRQLRETARYLPAIHDISRAVYDGETIQCTVTLASSTGETTEVITIEP